MTASHKQGVASSRKRAINCALLYIYRWMHYNGMEETQVTAVATFRNFFTAGSQERTTGGQSFDSQYLWQSYTSAKAA
jgi:hypothetical protein